MSESTNDQNKNEEPVNGQMNGELADDLSEKWSFDIQQLYKIGLKFYRDNESKAFHVSYDKRNQFVAFILQEKYGKFDPQKTEPLGALDIVGKDRRNAWIALSEMSQTEAQKGFIDLLNQLCPLFEPYVKAIKCDFDEKERIRREAEEVEQKRLQELHEKERIELENKRKNEEELKQFDEQKRAIQEVLNRQTLQQFKSYAEQQYPGNCEQQEILISQLQEQHYQQYMQQMLEQQLQRTHQQNTNKYKLINNQSETMNSQQINTFPAETLRLQHNFSEGGDQSVDHFQNNHSDCNQTASETDSEDESVGPIAGASMWTRKDINMFKESIRSEGGDGIIKVGHGEIVTVRVPTHKDGTCIFWEFSTDSYDIGFGLLFEWTKNPGNQVSVHISESEDEEDDEEEGDIVVGNDVEKGNALESDKDSIPSKRGQLEQSPISVIIPIYRRDSHEEVFAGSHAYPGKAVSSSNTSIDAEKRPLAETLISEDEAALYDRQIRLWGVSAQKKLRNANVLIAGINGIGSEIVKNIVLSGVNSMTLLDDQNVSALDSVSNLFTNRQIGKNRAEASLKYVQSLNPMVSVKYENCHLKDKDKEYFSAYDVVCLANYDKQTIINVNNYCNQLNVKFFATCNWGSFGFSFTDLGLNHNYFAEEEVQSGDLTITDYEPLKKKPKLEEPIKQIVEKKVVFVPFETALAVKAGKSGYGLTKRTNSTFIITHAMLEFHEKHSRYPSVHSREADVAELHKLQTEVLERLGLDESILKENNNWHNYVFGEMSPICAIIGGVLAQDIIRAVSAKDTPIRNFFLFDGIHCKGTIESIGK